MRLLTTALSITLLAGTAMAGEQTSPKEVAPGSAGIELGYLECDLKAESGSVVRSELAYDCTFDPAGDAPAAGYYAATADKVGLDLSKTEQETMRWLVVSATDDAVEPGALAGHYAGLSADASVSVGGGAKVLVGGFEDSITLQPVSLSTQKGYGVSLAVESMELTYLGARG